MWLEERTFPSGNCRVPMFEDAFGYRWVGFCRWGVHELRIPESYLGKKYADIVVRLRQVFGLSNECHIPRDPQEIYRGGDISLYSGGLS